MGGLSPAERRLVWRAVRSVSLLAILTVGALYATGGDVARPHGNPLVYAMGISWLIAVGVALPASVIFRMNTRLLPLARWEKDGAVYDRKTIRAFRWVVLQSPLGWINPNIHVSAGRPDWDRLLKEMHGSEAVHWITGVLASLLAVSYLVHGHATFGYTMLLVRIPVDVYPVMLLRRTRGRVCRLLRRALRTSA
jgi:hypothetical protein